MPDNIWHYAFDAEFPSVVRELVTDVSIFPSPNSQGIKTYLANGLLLPDIRFSVCDIPGTDVLIGMDIIMMGDFSISNGDGKTLFSFVIPPFKNKIFYNEKADSINRNALSEGQV